MARLLRLHLASVGHQDARFSPLTLDFRGPDGAAANTVLWLRNGGGKSSLLNLFYSTFIPQKARFLGKKSDGRSRELADYVQGHDLACVVSEWDMSSTPGKPAEIRIIGQIMSWKDARATPHDESRLERCFFTFRTNAAVNFDTLPVLGLSEQPSLSLTHFKDWLNWVKSTHRALEAESRMQKGEWVRVLADVGFDEDLFKYQLTMNGREGGADDLFRVRSADEFIELFLEMAYSPQQANETAKTLGSMREKLRKLPQHQLEERFTLELVGALQPLENAAAEMHETARRLEAQRRQNFLLYAAIKQSLELLNTHEIAAREEAGAVEEQLAELKRSRDTFVAYRRNYEILAAELAVAEAEIALKQAIREREESEENHRIAVAAEALVRLRTQENRLASLLRTRDELHLQQKPELDELKTAGAAYHFLLGIAEDEAKATLQSAEKFQSEAKGRRGGAEAKLTEIAKQESRTQSEFDQVVRQLVQRDQRREVLRKDGLIDLQEKASAAILRLEAVRKAQEQEAEQLDAAAKEAGRRGDESREAADKTAEIQRGHASREKGLADRVLHGDLEEAALQSHQCIRDALSSDSPDLEFGPLAELVRKRETDCLRRIVEMEMDVADDRRAETAIEADHLMPASRDVELALEHLRSRQVLSAMPAYHFLSQNERQLAAAEERLRSDPARYSGIMVNTKADLERIRAFADSVPALRHPVVVTLTGFADEDGHIPSTIVLMPESPGAFNQTAALAAKAEIEFRLKRAAENIQSLNEDRQEAATVYKRLFDYLQEFGRGTLARLRMEKRIAGEEAAAAQTKVANLREEAATFHARSADCLNTATGIRRKLPDLVGGIQRVQSYVQEFERHEEEWMRKRGEFQEKLASLKKDEYAVLRDKDEAEKQMESAAVDVASRRSCVSGLTSERATIQYRNEQPCGRELVLEQIRISYDALLRAFEQRYGGRQIDGQIQEAESLRVEMEKEFQRKRQQIDVARVEGFAREGDVTTRLETADRTRVSKMAAESEARNLLGQARTQVKPRAHKETLGLAPQGPKINTAAEARVQQAEMAMKIEETDAQREDIQSKLNVKREHCARLSTSLAARKPLLSVLEGYIEHASGSMPLLPEADTDLGNLVEAMKSTAVKFGREHDDAVKGVDALYEKLRAISQREEFHKLPATVREKLVMLPKLELLARCHELKGGYEERQRVLRAEIESYTSDKDLVVRELHNVARNAHNLLGQAERASSMPEMMPGWAGHPFLRIRSSEMPEPTACHERLGLLVNRLVEEKAIPEGHRLAFAAVREIAGPFKVTVLKPEPVLNPHRHDIVDFSSFSGGERLTAAILLYTALAQLRARSREGALRAREAGLLILDNPFGAASLRSFVDLQQRVARQMGVQLIYATGVNDLGALEVFPRILRLRNAHQDRLTGNKLVTEEPQPSSVRVAAANLRHE